MGQERGASRGTPPVRAGTTEVAEGAGGPHRGVRIQAAGLTRRVRSGLTILRDVSLTVEPGELVGIAGGSGTGKTTLLEALAGVQPPDEGSVRFDGTEIYRDLAAWRRVLGYVPQDDIIHAELPLARTLRYAARLRLPLQSSAHEIDRAVGEALRSLHLEERAGVPVRTLSGGQRKRASIAVELLTRPRVFFLDEPTSGLDPATATELLRVLRALAAAGATVTFTTHAVQDLASCDRIVFLAAGGHLAFAGTPAEAREYFEVEGLERVYERLATEAPPPPRPGPAGSATPLRPRRLRAHPPDGPLRRRSAGRRAASASGGS
jgi:ABC-type multidrug transport system ATPase subunit